MRNGRFRDNRKYDRKDIKNGSGDRFSRKSDGDNRKSSYEIRRENLNQEDSSKRTQNLGGRRKMILGTWTAQNRYMTFTIHHTMIM